MPEVSFFLVTIVVFAIAFDFINGFHDTANAVATVIATRVLSPRAAILMSGCLNLVGAMVATKVAVTISSGIVDPNLATQTLVLSAIIGAIVWNLITWFYGIPSSSSHALVGGLCGAAIAKGGLSLVLWHGVLTKVVIPLVISPLAGFLIGLILMSLITIFFAKAKTKSVSTLFKRLQLLSSAFMSFAHGQNDGQKSMGIITLALITNHLLPAHAQPPFWVKLSCAVAMGLGTASGGFRIIKTMGHKILRLEPVQGFAAETSGAAVILTASSLGATVSTTHVIAGSVFGVGAARRLSAVRWQVAINMVTAWVVTLPSSGLVAALVYLFLNACGVKS
jgi:PiT family inorganic phosphate transporter